MDKRYQVFISSTYADLQEERQEVMQALLELDCMPAGMELFPAANEDQWTLIKKVIDDCDYYIVIVAGRYGSIGPEGLSYTEMEYRYAVSTGKPVIGFFHRNPGSLQAARCESTDDGKRKLSDFRELVQKKMCKPWDGAADLGSQVSRSLIKLIKTNPVVGWVRADQVSSVDASVEILALKKKIELLESQLQNARVSAPSGTEVLSQGKERFEVDYEFTAWLDEFGLQRRTHSDSHFVSWDQIFSVLSPSMIDEASEAALKRVLDRWVMEIAREEGFSNSRASKFEGFHVNEAAFQTIKVQLRALGLIAQSKKNRSVKDSATYWTLTPYGDTVMTRLRAIKSKASSLAQVAND